MRKLLVLAVLASLAACGGGNNISNSGGTVSSPSVAKSNARISDIQWDRTEPGVTPFVSFVHLVGQELPRIQSISYVVEPKPDSLSKPVRVTYTLDALESRGRFTNGRLLLPVFGLYAEFDNEVSIELNFDDHSKQTIAGTLTTAGYTDPDGVYADPVFMRNRAAGRGLGADFYATKSGFGAPIIVDTDGAIRWIGTSNETSILSVSDFQFDSAGCNTAWDAVPVPLDDMSFT